MYLEVGGKVMRGDKEKCNFYLSAGTVRRFRDMCYLKHGCVYGALAFELENLMEKDLADFKNGSSTHTQNNVKALELKHKIMEWLISTKQIEDLYKVIISKSMLAQAITAVEGCTDDRTIRGRIHILVSKNCIKESEDSDKLNRRYTFVLGGDYLKKEEIK
jgi:hypothetical protein